MASLITKNHFLNAGPNNDLAGMGTETNGNTADFFLIYDVSANAFKKITWANVSSNLGGSGGLAYDGSTSNGLLTYKDADEITVESNATYNGTSLILNLDSNHTSAVSHPTVFDIDMDKTGITADGATFTFQAGARIRINDSATNHANATVNMTGLIVDIDSANDTGTLTNIGLDIDVTGADNNYAALFRTGRVGIGTATPAYKLDVAGSIRATGDVFLSENKSIYFDSTDTYIKAGTDNPEDLFIAADEDLFLRPDDNVFIQCGSTTYATFDGTNERLGLGTTAPKKNLHISDGSTSNITGGTTSALLITDDTNPRIYFEDASEGTNDKVMDIMYADEYMSFNSLVDTAASYDNQNIFMIHRNGQVGVGELHSSVATKLNVDGNFVAQSQYVASTASGNTNAADGANTWAKVCTFDPGGGQYKDANIILGVTNFNSSNTAAAIISVKFRTNAHQNAYNMDVAYIAKTGGVELDEDSFKIFSDGGAGNDCVSTMELWVNKASTWSGFNFYEISMRTNYIAGLTYHMNSAWQASAPTNTTQTAVTDGIELGLNTKMTDNKKLYFGGGKDLEIYHDGNDSFIKDTGTGDLKIDSSRIRLYHGGNEELYTYSGGIAVTGDLVVDGEGTTSSNITFNRAIDAFIKVDSLTGTDETGKHLTLQAGRGTGTGSGGSIFFQTADVGGSSNSTANAATNKMSILGNGNVGIGVDAPASYSTGATTLQVHDATIAELRLTTDQTGSATNNGSLIQAARAESTDNLYIWNKEAGKIVFATSGVERARIDASGNVGIGNTSPGFKLDVHGTFQAQADHTGNVIIDNTGEGQTILANHTGAGTPVPWDIRESSSANSNSADYGPLHITRMNMDADGAGSNIHFRAKANNGSAQEIGGIGATIDTGLTANATRTGSLHFYTTDAGTNRQEKMTIKSDGKVGIGDTSPDKALEVNSGSTNLGGIKISGTGVNTSLTIDNTGTNGGKYRMSVTSGSHGDGTNKLLIQDNNTARITLISSGNVGIGTTSPGHKLEVNGSFAATTKSFDIEHPTKEGMRLHHGSLEGPEHAVYIRGKNNSGTIHLPDYWQGLVDEDSITVQLTAIGKPQELYVREIKNGKVRVAAKVRGNYLNYFYFIQAERKDVDKMVVEYDG